MSEVICLSSDDEDVNPKKKVNKSKETSQSRVPIDNVKFKKKKVSVYRGFLPLSKKARVTVTPKVEEEEEESATDEDGVAVPKKVPESSTKDQQQNESKNPKKQIDEDWNRPSTSKQSQKPPDAVKVASKTQEKGTVPDAVKVASQIQGKETIPDAVKIASKTQRKEPVSDAVKVATKTQEKETVPDAPQLVIKEKRPVVNNHPGAEVFAQFLSQCLSRERSQDMEKIIQKLKRQYDQLDPDYARSSEFIDFLNEKRNLLLKDCRLYIHISDVVKDMKNNKRGVASTKPVPVITVEAKEPEKVANEEIPTENDLKLRKILKVMEKCEKRIKKLEETEIDWDDEENSNYMQVAKYKERMMQLYYKYCELTGEHEDAGRTHLRQKYLKVTKIESVDNAIVSFVTKRLMNKVKKPKKGQSTANSIVFPDYIDILTCIKKCNSEQNLGMNQPAVRELAKKAFKNLGEYLQKVRQQDFLDTFSLMDDGNEDPANNDTEIAAKLQRNSEQGKQRMKALLEKFVRKQEEGMTESDAETNEEKDEKNAKSEKGRAKKKGKEDDEDETSEDDEEDQDNSDTNDASSYTNDIDSNSIDIEDLETVSDESDKNDDEELSRTEEEETLNASSAKDAEKIASDEPAAKSPKNTGSNDEACRSSTLLKNEISDSQETLIITPPRNLQNRVVCSFEGTLGRMNQQTWESEGTVTVDKTSMQYEKEAQLKKIRKPGPKCMKSPLKPTITNIQNVKVVIRAHEIVDINGKLKEKCSKDETINSGETEQKIVEKESECLDDVPENSKVAEAPKVPEVTAEVIKHVEPVEPDTNVMIVDATASAELPETADTTEDKTLSPEKNADTAIKSSDCPETQESVVIIDEITENTKTGTSELKSDKKSRKRIAPTQLLTSSPKICKTSTPIKSNSSETLVQKNKFILLDEVTIDSRTNEIYDEIMEVSAIKKDSKDDQINIGNQISLDLEDEKAVDDAKVEIEVSTEDDDKKPLLKLRSFAKPPEYWTNSPKKNQISIKTIKTSEPIEIVDLDDDDVGRVSVITCQRKTPNKLIPSGNKKSPGTIRVTIRIPSTSSLSSTKQRAAGVIKIATINPTTSNNRLIGQVKPMKNNNTLLMSRNKNIVVLPYNRVKPTTQSSGDNQSNVFPITNAIASLSSLQNSVKSAVNNVNDRQLGNTLL